MFRGLPGTQRRENHHLLCLTKENQVLRDTECHDTMFASHVRVKGVVRGSFGLRYFFLVFPPTHPEKHLVLFNKTFIKDAAFHVVGLNCSFHVFRYTDPESEEKAPTHKDIVTSFNGSLVLNLHSSCLHIEGDGALRCGRPLPTNLKYISSLSDMYTKKFRSCFI